MELLAELIDRADGIIGRADELPYCRKFLASLMELFTILTELLAVVMKLLNFSDIIDHIYDVIENGNAIIDRTD